MVIIVPIMIYELILASGRSMVFGVQTPKPLLGVRFSPPLP